MFSFFIFIFFFWQCKYKTECEELELAYALDTSLNYDVGHGQELAVETDKNFKDRSSYPRLRLKLLQICVPYQ